MTRIITVTSGQAGAGKTSISVNLAARLARRGQRVCLLDADPGRNNIVQVLGLKPVHTLEDSLRTAVPVDNVLISTAPGFDLLPGSSRVDWFAGLAPEQLQDLAASMGQLDGYDFLLIDSCSSSARNVLSLALASPEVMLLITPEPTSLGNAFALLELLYAEQYDGRTHVVVNRSTDERVGTDSYTRFRDVADLHLDMQLPLLGLVGDDRRMPEALHELQAGGSVDAPSLAGQAIAAIADQLLRVKDAVSERDIHSFCKLCLRAAGVAGADEPEALPGPGKADTGKQELQRQIECLSAEVDALIAEVERLRSGSARRTAEFGKLPAGRRDEAAYRSEACLAAMASHSEAMTVQGHRFSIYHMNRANGPPLRFACQSPDDEFEETETRTTNS